MVRTFFSIENKKRRLLFFEKTFLLIDIGIDITPEISFFTLNNIKIDFVSCHIQWIMYIITRVLLTIR